MWQGEGRSSTRPIPCSSSRYHCSHAGVHVRGTWLTSHFGARHWNERAKAGEPVRGRIVNTTSGAGLLGNFGQSNYATAKAAIVGLTLALSLELAASGVTVNCVSPNGATRISASVGGRGTAREPDQAV